MFWGLVLKTNKRYSQQVSKAFHVSQAVLDIGTVNPNDNDAVVQVWLNTDDTDHLIANVGRKTSHVQLDLTFTEGETVAFYSKGSGTVHLTGYLLPDDEDDFGDFAQYGEQEESDEEVEAPTNKQKVDKKQLKAVKADEEEEEEEDDDEDDSDIERFLAKKVDDEEDSDDDDDDEDDDDDDDEDDDDDDDDDDDEDDDDEDDSDEIEAPQSKKAKLENVAKQNGLTNGMLPKKELEKQKNQQKTQKQDKQQEQKQKQQQQQQQQKKPTPKTLKGGVIVEDLRVGKGPEAQAGKKVFVYYEGRLKSNNKMFDSTKSGEGFKFTLGRGEVIQGWDIGVAGMKVGSKRRITCPPHAAYGHKGAPPQIPGNSTLIFDVELRNIK